jgi:hypothetical protein
MAANCRRSTKNQSAKLLHTAPSDVENRAGTRRKVPTLRVPPGKLIKAQAMLVQGHSNREISRTLHMSTHTVAKAIRTEEFQSFRREMQEQLFAIAPDALASFRAAVRMDGHLAYIFMKDLGIVPTAETLSRLLNPPSATTPEEERLERQVRGMAACILESHRTFGIDLPANMQRVLDLDEPDSKE